MAEVEWEKHDSVLVVTLNRPERRNAVGGAMFRLLREAFAYAAASDDIRAVVTTGAGSSFCVGADISRLAEVLSDDDGSDGSDGSDGKPNRGGGDNGLRPLSPAEQLLDLTGPGRWMAEMLAFPKPTIAAVNGAAAGGGLCLAVMHHFRVAAADAKFAAGFVALGLAPEMGLTRLLPRLAGDRVARRMLVLNELLSGPQAYEAGLVDEVTQGPVLDAALDLAHRIGVLPPLAVTATLRLLSASRDASWQQVLESEYATQRILFASRDHQAAVSAFTTRAAVTFEGR
jgi:2-(1,2-epoxy-1,2-dihydrophenyl)acetyl-CoA isomerase